MLHQRLNTSVQRSAAARSGPARTIDLLRHVAQCRRVGVLSDGTPSGGKESAAPPARHPLTSVRTACGSAALSSSTLPVRSSYSAMSFSPRCSGAIQGSGFRLPFDGLTGSGLALRLAQGRRVAISGVLIRLPASLYTLPHASASRGLHHRLVPLPLEKLTSYNACKRWRQHP